MKDFLDLVEIRTKVASVFPFFLGLLYSLVVFDAVNWVNSLIFFVAMLLFDMATTIMNNLMDYVKAKNLDYRDKENILGTSHYTVKSAASILIAFVALSAVLGLVLVWRTNLLLLLVGMICFFIGLFYTFGPIPISRMPLGEILSGFTMGFGIFWIVLFLNNPQSATASLSWQDPYLLGTFHLWNHLKIFLLSLPLVATIAGIMLANNICDLDTDVSNHRYTLVYYLGKSASLVLYQGLYVLAYGAIVLAVLVGWAPIWMLLSLVTAMPVFKKVRAFVKEPVKSKTFKNAVQNLILLHSSQILILLVLALFG